MTTVFPIDFRRPLMLFVLTALLIVALGAAPAPARAGLGVSCPDPTVQAFRSWNDFAQYAFVPNGGFESGTSGWTVSGGAKVVAGNESFNIRGAGDRYSLSLPGGSTATTPPMCIGLLSSKMRFFLASMGSSSSRLKVQVIYNGGVGSLTGLLGKTLGISDVAFLSGTKAWQPSPEVSMLGGVLPLLTKSVQFRFSVDRTGSWRIDDVFLDPLMHR